MEENKNFVPDNVPADLEKSWHIPRPTLARSSNSSQGSTSSNNSTQSVRSGSLLLTAASLAQIHHQSQQLQGDNVEDGEDHRQQRRPSSNKIRDQNIQYYLQTQMSNNSGSDKALSRADLILPMNPDKKMEPDNVSIASSTHFTVVNVNTRTKPPERGFCRKHQLTILVLTMSALFTVGILTAILLLEMRAKNQRYH